MKILLVDDSETARVLLERFLIKAGYTDLEKVDSAAEAFDKLGMNGPSAHVPKMDLILLDVVMPEMDGIEACQRIKAVESLRDIPIIMVTGKTDDESLQRAFNMGAIDYITKPLNKVELLARVRSALKLKQEMDDRKEATRQLEAANHQLQLLSLLDGLTGIANRRNFDETLDKEWRRGLRDGHPLSLILIDIDCFKAYNDNYGHQAGDECLKLVAQTIAGMVKRPGDLAARYGGEEFVVVLPETDMKNAALLAEELREKVESGNLPHAFSKVAGVVTLSLGVASALPSRECTPASLIEAADQALYQAKHSGRNRVGGSPEKRT
jgi:diguanylate cyclase (GGDEF)-like protein